MEQDGFDQGDDIPAGIVSGADNSNVDCLEEKRTGWAVRQTEGGLPGASDHTRKKNCPDFFLASLENKGHRLQLWKITHDSFIKAFLIGLWSYYHLETIKSPSNYILGTREMVIGSNRQTVSLLSPSWVTMTTG